MIAMTETRWLTFKELESKPKTKVYSVLSLASPRQAGDELGEIRWHPPWRHYCFFPTTEFKTVHSDRCLAEISDFVHSLNREHKDKI